MTDAGSGQGAAGRRSRRDTGQGPSTVAGHVGALPLVEHAPYRPERTLPVRVELVRQLRAAPHPGHVRAWSRCCR